MASAESQKTAVNEDTPQGLGYSTAAYVLWGFLPLYLKALSHVPAVEIVVHRVIWSVPLAGAVLILMGRTGQLREALSNPRTLAMGFVTAALVSINWGIYIWAIANDRTIEAALGYYINPLFSVFLGAVLLGEKLQRAQLAALALAALAVMILTVDAGQLPWPALGVMLSWGFYALAKKQLSVGPNQGFLLEVLILLGPALIWLAHLQMTGQSHFANGVASDTWLLVGCGVVTAVPLMLFANGVRLLRMSTTGILQFIAPTLIFLCAVVVFGEPFGIAEMIAFPMIWVALVIYCVAMVRGMRRATAQGRA